MDISDALGLVLRDWKRGDHQSNSKISMKDRDQKNQSLLQLDRLLDFLLAGRSEQRLEVVLMICSDTGMGPPLVLHLELNWSFF